MSRALALTALVAAAGCKKDEPSEPVESTAAVVDDAAPPVDHLGKGELLEGSEKALTLTLPRVIHVDNAFVQVVYASGNASPEAVANFFKARVRDGSVTRGASATVFENVRVPDAPGVLLRVRVQPMQDGIGTSVEVRDVTPPPAAVLPDEESRWKAAGLTPSGTLADPKHTQ